LPVGLWATLSWWARWRRVFTIARESCSIIWKGGVMQPDENLLETWKRSVIEIQQQCNWVILWDGYLYYPGAIPREVEGRALYIVTAYNPGSVLLTVDENEIRDKRLFARISSLGSAGIYVSVGRSLSGSHTEFGYAVHGVSKGEVDDLANEFGQIGYYRLTQSSMEIFAVDGAGEFKQMF